MPPPTGLPAFISVSRSSRARGLDGVSLLDTCSCPADARTSISETSSPNLTDPDIRESQAAGYARGNARKHGGERHVSSGQAPQVKQVGQLLSALARVLADLRPSCTGDSLESATRVC